LERRQKSGKAQAKMNQNFQGAPDREDIRLLDQLRSQLMPMIKGMERLQAEMQYKMSRGEVVDW